MRCKLRRQVGQFLIKTINSSIVLCDDITFLEGKKFVFNTGYWKDPKKQFSCNALQPKAMEITRALLEFCKES